MILKDIVNNDMEHCDKVFRENKELRYIEEEAGRIIKTLDKEVGKEIQNLFIAHGARIASLAYMQGIKDFRDMFVDLQEDTNVVIDKMEQRIVEDRKC